MTKGELEGLCQTIVAERDEARDERDNARGDVTRLINERDDARRSVTNLTNERDNALRNVTTLTNERDSARGCVQQLNATIQNKDDVINDMRVEATAKNTQIVILQGQLKDVKDENNALLAAGRSSVPATSASSKKQVLLISDLREAVESRLGQSHDWNVTDDITTWAGLNTKIQSNAFQKMLRKFDLVIILLGKDEIEKVPSISSMIACIDPVINVISRNTNVAICQLPPSKLKLAEFAWFNQHLVDNVKSNDHVIVVQTLQTYYDRQLPKDKTVNESDNTLTDLGSEVMSEIIRGIKVPESSPYIPDEDDSKHGTGKAHLMEEMMIPAEKAGLIIGRGGSNVRNVEAITGVSAKVVKWTDNGVEKRSILISGSSDNIDQAKSEFSNLIENSSSNPSSNVKKECHYFAAGNCRNGDTCGFSHSLTNMNNKGNKKRGSSPSASSLKFRKVNK